MKPIIIIGGGAVGLSVAYHLAKRGCRNIKLLERNQLSSGTSWHAAGIVGPLRATPNMTRLAMYAGELFPTLEQETSQSTGYRLTGGYWLAREPERMDELHRIAALGNHFGLTVTTCSVKETQQQLPYLDLSGHSGSISVAEDANVNPVDLCVAYSRAAKALGVEILENTSVTRIVTEGDKVTGVQLSDGTTIKTDKVALCGGAWSKPLAEQAGLPLPLQAVEHMYVVTEAMSGLPDPFPVIRDLDTGIYIKGDSGGKLVIGGFEPDAKCWDAFGSNGNVPFLELSEDWDQFMPFLEAAIALCPQLESAGIQHFMNGPESFTMDTKPLIGLAPQVDGLFVAAGMNSVGIMSSAGVGRVLADWMTDGEAPMDLWEVDVARADPLQCGDAYIKDRMKEAVSDQFTVHWPFKQPTTGRGLRKSVLHDKWQLQGAVIGLTAGWERGLWYAQTPAEQHLPYSVDQQHWQTIAQREAAMLLHGTALLDLTPFSKFDISGTDACQFMQQLVCSNANVENGTIVYTQILNDKGGIEADITVSRITADHYRITSGAATRWRDLALLNRQASGYSVRITDTTEKEAVIGVMGHGSRALLAPLLNDTLQSFNFGTFRQVRIAGCTVTASRISYVGELGWELGISNDHAGHVFDRLIQAGARPMGHYALDSCRIEKGFRHWGHDIGPDISPLQAGLGFVVDWSKDFTGKAALLNQKEQGLTTRLCLFSIEGQPLMLHDEPIWEAGKVVGLTTSGTLGVRTNLTLAFGFIDIARNETLTQTAQRQFEIQVAAKHYKAKVLEQVPYDPSGRRMRS